jgi:hypothetical protein
MADPKITLLVIHQHDAFDTDCREAEKIANLIG